MGLQKSSYTIESFKFKKEELRRLEKRASFKLEKFIDVLSRIRLKKNSKILEVGPGTGHRSSILSKKFKQNMVVGADTSQTMIELCKKKYGKRKNLTFQKTNILDPKSNIRKQRFSLIYIRLVLQHQSHPQKMIRICQKLLSPGGYLIVEDVDRELMTFYPTVRSWENIYKKAISTQTKSNGDPLVGRKINALLKKAGFKKIENFSYVNFGNHTFFKDWLKLFAPSFFNYMNDHDQKTAKKVLADLAMLSKTTEIEFIQLWFLYCAKK